MKKDFLFINVLFCLAMALNANVGKVQEFLVGMGFIRLSAFFPVLSMLFVIITGSIMFHKIRKKVP